MNTRKRLLTLVGLVLAIDAAAVAIYYLAGIERAGRELKLGFTIAWTALTLAVVLTQLRRMRLERTRQRRAGR